MVALGYCALKIIDPLTSFAQITVRRWAEDRSQTYMIYIVLLWNFSV